MNLVSENRNISSWYTCESDGSMHTELALALSGAPLPPPSRGNVEFTAYYIALK